MRRALTLALISVAALSATPAMASLTLNGNGSLTTGGTSGGSQTVFMNGLTDGPTLIPGLTGQLTLTFSSVTNGGLTYNFLYDLFNSSSAPITASRISSFGFNTSPDVASGVATGVFNTVHVGSADNFPIIPNPEDCAFASNNPPHGVCTGSGGGVDLGQHGTGTLSLTFASAPTGNTITLSSFVDRYQSIAGAGNTTSAVGQQVPPVPEPAAWALMLLGFGGIGIAMRHRRKNGQLVQIA